MVEFFEWFNTLETFKNWKKSPGKPLEVQLDELSKYVTNEIIVRRQANDAVDKYPMDYEVSE